jgi:hypothetical protein
VKIYIQKGIMVHHVIEEKSDMIVYIPQILLPWEHFLLALSSDKSRQM